MIRKDSNAKHILLLNRSFWPDTESTGQYLTELCRELVKRYKVRVIAGRSYYIGKDGFKLFQLYKKEVFADIEILRVRHTRFWKANLIARLLNWLTYTMLTFFAALRMKPRVVIVGTDPPFLGIVTLWLKYLKGIPYIYNCRDLYPDIAWELGKLKKGNLISRGFDYLNKKALSAARFVVPLGESMQARIEAKGIPKERIRLIPHWVDTASMKPVAKEDNEWLERFGLKNKFVIMYSGNLGLSQGLGSILRATVLLKENFLFSLVFIGDGAGKRALVEEVNSSGLKNILFFPYQPQGLLSFTLSMADLHLVPLKKGMQGAIVPSKVYNIMAVARPYLAITDKESEPARLANEYGCGLWVGAFEPEQIAESLKWALTHQDELEEMGSRGRHIVEEKFAKETVVKEWFSLLDNVN